MTDYEFNLIVGAKNALTKAEKDLNDFKVERSSLSFSEFKSIRPDSTKITIDIYDGHNVQKRDIIIPKELVEHLYHQELNKRTTALFKAQKEFDLITIKIPKNGSN